MSGYRNMWFTTGEEHRAYLAFAAVNGAGVETEQDADDETLLDWWDGLHETDRRKWVTAAELVAHDVKGMPR